MSSTGSTSSNRFPATPCLIRPLQGLALLLILSLACIAGPVLAGEEPPWVEETAQGRQVHLYFFWTESCPHCQKARPFVEGLTADRPWLHLHSAEIRRGNGNAALYAGYAAALGADARAVPAFFVCGRLLEGFDSSDERGQDILRLADACHTSDEAAAEARQTVDIRIPGLAELDPERLSLPVLTVVLAGLDAFNPCAFFVLLFLLSLLVNTRSRGRMLLVGGIFVFSSGLVYFLFMAAWLNLFLLVRGASWVTTIAGGVAVLIGILNTKDFFLLGQGPSLSMSDGQKAGLFARMRGLMTTERLPLLLTGTVMLSLAANSYELLCTAGFPMVYTRILTLAPLNPAGHYGYLLIYNLIYVLPLLLIVLLFTFTLGRHKLSEQQGRLLKLVSGLMMLGLGVLLVAAPQALTRPWTGLILILSALLIALLMIRWQAVMSRRQ